MRKIPYKSLTVFREGGITQIGFSPLNKEAFSLGLLFRRRLKERIFGRLTFLGGNVLEVPSKITHLLRNLVVTGLGTGYSPWAPGTMGTLLALPLVIGMSKFSPIIYMLITLVLTLVSIILTDWYESERNSHDNSEIVIDEILGLMVTMVLLPINATSLIAGFILFRLLDILKPFPINYIDKRVGGGVGVIGDDILAGVIANVILQIVYAKTTWLV